MRKPLLSLLIPPKVFQPDDINLLVLRIKHAPGDGGFQNVPRIVSGQNQLPLTGRWQFRLGHDSSWSNMPLPAKSGGSTDMLFEPK